MAKENKTTKKKRDYAPLLRAIHLIFLTGSVGSAIVLGLLTSEPGAGLYILSSLNALTAAYFTYLIIK